MMKTQRTPEDLACLAIDAKGTIATALKALSNEERGAIFSATCALRLVAVALQTIIDDLREPSGSAAKDGAS